MDCAAPASITTAATYCYNAAAFDAGCKFSCSSRSSCYSSPSSSFLPSSLISLKLAAPTCRSSAIISRLQRCSTWSSLSECGGGQSLSSSQLVAGKLVGNVTREQASSSLPSAFPLSDLYEFICNGPLLAKIGASRESVIENLDDWLSLGVKLSRLLGFNELHLLDSEKVRIYHYYVPVFFWCKKELSDHHSKFQEGDPIRPLVIGINAPQGCGKTTLVDSLEFLLNSVGSRAAAVSIDDFYLTAADQAKLAAENVGNSLLELRGNAGTHDLPFGTEALKSLRSLTSSGAKVKVPRYEKSAYNGRGDRADSSTWTEIEGPLEVLLFEGWMLGFEPLEASKVTVIDPQLERVNTNMALYIEAWYKYIDSWIIVQVDDPSWVYQWRLEAETEMRAKGKPSMSDEEVADFVSRYMPAYKAYLPKLYSEGPSMAKPEHTLKFNINQHRNPMG